jgi:hypothetical protein
VGNHVLRDRIWDSKKLERCSDGAAAWYPWIFLVADDWGRFEYHPHAIWMCVFRRRPSVSLADVEKWLTEYQSEGLLVRFTTNSGLAFWTGFKGRKESERRDSQYPDPMEFEDVREMLAFIEGGGRPAERARRRRGNGAEASRKDRALSEQIGDGDRSEIHQTPGARAPRRKASKTPEEFDTRESRSLVDAYNAVFGTSIGYTPGNLRAAVRAFSQGYSLEHCKTVFEAVRERKTTAAQWCWENNREFEYLIRPAYRHNRSQEITQGPLDKIPNELATGRKAS